VHACSQMHSNARWMRPTTLTNRRDQSVVLRPREPNNCLTSPWQIARFQEIPEVWGGEDKMPIYSCPRCGGKDGYTKRIHELRADGLKRTTITSWAKVQKFRNIDLVITACKSCGEEMDEEFTPAEVEENNKIIVEQTIESASLGKRIYRIVGYVLMALSAWVFVTSGVSVVTGDRTDFILPMMFWTLALGIPGIYLLRKYSKTLVAVWIVSPGKNTSEVQSLLTEFAKSDKQLSAMLGYMESNTLFNASGLIGIEQAREFGERLERLGADVRIG
jgi:hypothetical protein